MSLIHFLKNVFSRHNYQVEPTVEVCDCHTQNPVVTIVVGHKRVSMSTTQARSLWGKLGQNLERVTPDPKEYRQ